MERTMFMKKIFLATLMLIFLPLQSYPAELTNQKAADKEEISIDSKQLDKRAVILKDYLQRYNSPLQYHAQDFIDAADESHVDWKLVPSIAGVESTFGKFTPGGFNAWGWGVYGTQALGFDSWRDGIFTVTQGLKQNYIDKGLNDPMAMNHVYAASPSWGWKVSYFLNDLDQFTKIYESKEPTQIQSVLHKTAGSSAELALKLINN